MRNRVRVRLGLGLRLGVSHWGYPSLPLSLPPPHSIRLGLGIGLGIGLESGFDYFRRCPICVAPNTESRNATQWRNETLQNACKTNGQQSQNGRVNDVIAHRKFLEKFQHPIFPEKLQPYFWSPSLLYVLIFYAGCHANGAMAKIIEPWP